MSDLGGAAQAVEHQRCRREVLANDELRQDLGHAAGVVGAEAGGEGEALDPVEGRRIRPIEVGDHLVDQQAPLGQIDDPIEQRAQPGHGRGLADAGQPAQHQEIEVGKRVPSGRQRPADRTAGGDLAKPAVWVTQRLAVRPSREGCR